VADVLTGVVTRLDAILRAGRGADGSLGADAQARAIPADRYRKGTDGQSLRDVAYPINAFDRAYAYEWGELGYVEERGNDACSRILLRVRCVLLLGHVYGAANAAMLRIVGSEVAATAALNARSRAIGDVVRIRRALCFGPLYGNDTEPPIVSLEMDGTTSVEDFGDRLLTSIPFSVVVNASNTEAYTP
jgi:hypothetical protein